MGWRLIKTFDPSYHTMVHSRFLVAGVYPNGVRWTDCCYWDARGYFSGRKTRDFQPQWWQPMPEPPTEEEDEAMRDFEAITG